MVKWPHSLLPLPLHSAPFEYLGEMVDVRSTQNTVEIFYHHQRICSHKREWGEKRYITIQDHMPPGKLFFVDWNADRFIRWAGNIGPACIFGATGTGKSYLAQALGQCACRSGIKTHYVQLPDLLDELNLSREKGPEAAAKLRK